MRFNMNRRRNRKSNPFVGIIFGIGLFFGSFVTLYLNEGRVDLSKIADDAVALSASSVDGSYEGSLVAVSGILHSDTPVSDNELLTSGNFLQLERYAEMYAWSESRETDDDGPTTYEYRTTWTDSPESSENFNEPSGHINPRMPYRSEEFTVESLTLGAYSINPTQLFFRQAKTVALEPSMLKEGRVDGDYLFIGTGSVSDPLVGDLRIKYTGFANDQEVTLFGKQEESQIRPYRHKDDTLLFRVYPADRETAIANMRSEFLALIWGFRIGGMVMMWLGLMAIVSPLTRLLGHIPLLGDAGNMLIAIVAFAIAFTLSVITIIISAIIHNPIALIIILLLFIGGGYFIWRQQQGKEKTAVVD